MGNTIIFNNFHCFLRLLVVEHLHLVQSDLQESFHPWHSVTSMRRMKKTTITGHPRNFRRYIEPQHYCNLHDIFIPVFLTWVHSVNQSHSYLPHNLHPRWSLSTSSNLFSLSRCLVKLVVYYPRMPMDIYWTRFPLGNIRSKPQTLKTN